jgi:hypothetical protein
MKRVYVKAVDIDTVPTTSTKSSLTRRSTLQFIFSAVIEK